MLSGTGSVALFDCDGTLIFNDIADTFLAAMAKSFSFAESLPMLSLLDQQRAELLAKLWRSRDERFAGELLSDYSALLKSNRNVALLFAASALSGFSVADAKAIIDELLPSILSDGELFETLPTLSGSIRWSRRVATIVPVADALRQIASSGVPTAIVSASSGMLVSSLVARMFPGLTIDVFGIELARNEQGVLLPKAARAITDSAGKARLIADLFPNTKVQIAFGNSKSDFDMLSLAMDAVLIVRPSETELARSGSKKDFLIQVLPELEYEE